LLRFASRQNEEEEGLLGMVVLLESECRLGFNPDDSNYSELVRRKEAYLSDTLSEG
jgi:hypothetical protein